MRLIFILLSTKPGDPKTILYVMNIYGEDMHDENGIPELNTVELAQQCNKRGKES